MPSTGHLILFWITLVLITSKNTANGGKLSQGLAQKLKSDPSNRDAVLEFPSIMSTVLSNPILSLLPTGPVKIDMLIQLMQKLTTAAQAPIIQSLTQLGLQDLTPFWITNSISLKDVPPAQLKAVALLPGLFTLREPYKVRAVGPLFDITDGLLTDVLGGLGELGSNLVGINKKKKATTTKPTTTTLRPDTSSSTVQWNVKNVDAPYVWAHRTKGERMLVANIDTGVNAGHEALKSNWAGQWLDAINGRSEPYDDNGHGTHTMGTLCGTKGIGVAPAARWVACKALDNNNLGTDTSLVECAEWILKLRPVPTVVSNSWGGDQGAHYYDDVIKAWLAAGIFPVFASGNDGPGCSTALSPGDQPQVISVGSTNSTNVMSYFSSRGPSIEGKMKPDVAAPGGDVLSADSANVTGYVLKSGTSMATPAVAGAMTLMLSANPKLTYDEIRSALTKTAIRPQLTAEDAPCGNAANGGEYPNNAMGWGRINVKNAMGL